MDALTPKKPKLCECRRTRGWRQSYSKAYQWPQTQNLLRNVRRSPAVVTRPTTAKGRAKANLVGLDAISRPMPQSSLKLATTLWAGQWEKGANGRRLPIHHHIPPSHPIPSIHSAVVGHQPFHFCMFFPPKVLPPPNLILGA